MELVKNGAAAALMESGAIVKTAFCGPCFGAGDTPSNNSLSIRHSTRNFPNREGSKLQNGQIASVALMDARSIAATAANKGYLTPATDLDVEYTGRKYHFDSSIYANRVFDSKGVADPSVEIKFGPNIKEWPKMSALPENRVYPFNKRSCLCRTCQRSKSSTGSSRSEQQSSRSISRISTSN